MKLPEKKIRELDIKIDKLREKFKRSEDFETFEAVFDTLSLMTVYDLANSRYIDILNGVVSTGKEANVYWAVSPDGEDLAVKIYRTSTADFKKMYIYIVGDPRFKAYKKKTHAMVYLWAQKEFKNLHAAHACGVRVPKPIVVKKNVLVMEFIGEQGVPAPLLKDVRLKRPKPFFEKVILYMTYLFQKAELVHADLSEYNIMVYNNEPVFIDLSQAVQLSHPNSLDFLVRDIKNIYNYFMRYISIPSIEELFKKITGLSADEYPIIFENT